METKSANALLLKKEKIQIDVFEWGRLEWHARKNIDGGDITLGFCHIYPGMENAMHFHPNCDEVLHVIQGAIIHRFNGEEINMNEGDTLVIPKGTNHNAYNNGDAQALLSIAFNTGERQTKASPDVIFSSFCGWSS
jgi:quercetin dioxygenase-like cupin family protein